MATRVQHDMTGHMNPHCQRCGRTAMQIAQRPAERCERMTLPFDLPLVPAKAELRTVNLERRTKG